MDIRDMTNGEIMVYNGKEEWFGFTWKDNEIVNVLIPWSVMEKVVTPRVGNIVTAKPKNLKKIENGTVSGNAE